MESPTEHSDGSKKPKKFKKNKSNRSGVDYEMGLLMLFLKRAAENLYQFELAGELYESEKIDDLYFKDYSTGNRVYLLQAKHKANVSRTIQFDDLKSQSNTDFSLLKYFNSYRKIKEKTEFQSDLDSMNFILCTTVHLDSDHSNRLKNTKSIQVIQVKDNDGIFKMNKRELGKRYKLKIHDTEERENIFKNSYSSLKTMANKLVECVLEDKNINIEQIPSIRRYHVALAENVIDVGRRQFRSEFLNNQGLCTNANKFRGIFYNSVQEYLKGKEDSLQALGEKKRKKMEVILKEFREVLCGAENEMYVDALNEKLKSKELKLVGNFGKLNIKNLKEFVQELSDALSDREQKAVEVTKDTSFGKNLRLLGGYVMIIEDGVMKFNEGFLTNEELPTSFREFRNHLRETLGAERFYELRNSKLDFIFKTQNDSKLFEDKIFWELEDDFSSNEIMDSEINEFLGKLMFVVTPKSDEIRKVIENEMKEEFGPRGKNIFGCLNAKILDWMNYTDGEGQGYYLSHENNIYTESKRQCLGSTWFRVKNTVKSFTGRELKIDEICSCIHNGTVVISGLSGVGKTELALKYIHEKYSKKDNVIWTDAETRKSAMESFHSLYQQLGFNIEDEHKEQKSIKVISEGLYGYFGDLKTLVVFDNAECLSEIEEFLPQAPFTVVNTLRVLITSPNSLEWKSSRYNISTLHLSDFLDSEAIKFVERTLSGVDECQQDIRTLTQKLHNFPLALDQAVTYIRDENEERQEKGLEFRIRDYLEKYEQTPKLLLNVKLPPDAHVEGTCKTLKLIFKKIVNNKTCGHQALKMLSIMSYFSQSNIPERTFLTELADNDYEKLTLITRLLKKYSTVSLEKGMLHVHGLVQEVRRLELEGVNEEEVLQTALKLLRRYVSTRKSIEGYISHIVSVWKYASKYDKLIYDFIVEDIVDSTDTNEQPRNSAQGIGDFSSSSELARSLKVRRTTSFLHILSGSSRCEVFCLILDKIKNLLSRSKMFHKFINARSEDKKTFLHYAAEGGDVRIVELLIENKANVDTRDRIDSRPLHLAAKHGHLSVVSTLISKKVDVNAKTSPEFAYTPLHFAAQNGHLDIVGVLLGKNAEINSQTTMGFTPLHLASLKGYLEIVESLLNNGADINMATSEKYTALHFAVKNNHFAVVDLLLNRGAYINSPDNKNFAPLHWAALNGSENIINCLLKNPNVNIEIESTEGKTPLHLAQEKGHSHVIAVLAERQKYTN